MNRINQNKMTRHLKTISLHNGKNEKTLSAMKRLANSSGVYSINPVNYFSFVEKVEQVIYKHLSNEDFCIQDLSKSLNMSRSQLYRKLKKELGQSFSALVKEIKINEAKRLLLHQDIQISEITYRLGYRDPSYFSKVFKGSVGCNPSHYRERMRTRRRLPMATTYSERIGRSQLSHEISH